MIGIDPNRGFQSRKYLFDLVLYEVDHVVLFLFVRVLFQYDAENRPTWTDIAVDNPEDMKRLDSGC